MDGDASLRILVVEDEFLMRWSVAETLTHAGHAIVEASDGAGAVNAVRESMLPIDVVLLDYRLPDSRDLRLLANLRRLSPSSAIVVMTAEGTPEMTASALHLGAFHVLAKPFDMSDIAGVVQRAHQSRFN